MVIDHSVIIRAVYESDARPGSKDRPDVDCHVAYFAEPYKITALPFSDDPGHETPARIPRWSSGAHLPGLLRPCVVVLTNSVAQTKSSSDIFVS